MWNGKLGCQQDCQVLLNKYDDAVDIAELTARLELLLQG
jgi:hypothetical protein